MHSVGKQGLDGIRVELFAALLFDPHARRYPTNSRQTQRAEEAYEQPADVHFPTLHCKSRRTRERMMVVVQLLTSEQQTPGQEIGRRTRHLVATVTDGVSQPVDHAA